MTTQITARDKKLLILLAVFLLCAGVYWFAIRPLTEEISGLKTELADSQLKENELRYKIGRIPSYEEGLKDQAEDLRTNASSFYPMMESHDVDELLTGLALSSGLSQTDLRDLSIEYPSSELTLQPYLDTGKGTALAGIYGVPVTFVLLSEREALQNFLDLLIKDCPSLRVDSYSWAQLSKETTWTLTLHLQVYMTDHATVADAVEALTLKAE